MPQYDENNITGLQTPTQNNVTNLTNKLQKTIEEPFASSELYQETQRTREEAISSTLAGEPNIPTLNLPEKKPDLSETPVTKSFTTRDQVMSRLGLMDENYNYTDTYTNYVQQGGQPVPGYEYAHKELLDQERYDRIFQKVDDGELSYDTALLDAYGKDIMATSFNMDMTSVAYWKSKFFNSDYSNPFANRYLMDQVKQACEEYHKARQSGQFANSQSIKTATVTSLFGEELEASQVKDIFGDLGKYAEEQKLSDEDLLKQINGGAIPATARLMQIDDTTWAYLHTDGKLHKLNKGTDIKFDDKGNPTEISLNGGKDTIDFLDHFGSSFAGVFRGIVKLGALVTAIDGLWNGDGYVTNLAKDTTAIDAFFNDADWNTIGRLDHIDLDGFNWSGKDIFMALGDITGMLAGSATLAGVAGWASNAGQSLMQSTNVFAKGAGLGLRSVGHIGLRSTGWYAGLASPDKATVFGKVVAEGSKAHWLNTAFKVTPWLAAKDFYNTAQQLNTVNIQAQLNGQENVFSEEEMLRRSAIVTSVSWIGSTILSSNIDSSFSERWMPKKWEAISRVSNPALQQMQGEIASNAKNTALRELLTRESNLLKLDNVVDMFNTLMGNQVQAAITSTKKVDGKLTALTFGEYINGYQDDNGKVGALWTRPDFWKDVVQTGVMQFKEYRKDKQKHLTGYNTAIQSLRGANEDFLLALDADIAKASPKNKETLQAVKLEYSRILNDTSNGDSYEARIVKAMDNLSTNLGKVPKSLKDSIIANVNKEKTKYYQETLNFMNLKMEVYKDEYSKFYSRASTEPGFIKKLYSGFFAKAKNSLRGLNEKDKKSLDRWAATSKLETDHTIYDSYLQMVDLEETTKVRDNLALPKEAFDYADSMNAIRFEDLETKADQDAITRELKNKQVTIPPEGFVVYKFKEEAGYSDSKFNARMKQNVNKTTMDLLEQQGNYGVYKINDNMYVMSTVNSTAGQVYTFESQCNINSGIWAIKNNAPIEGTRLILGTLMGDTAFKKAASNTDIYDTLHAIFEGTVSNKVLTDLEVADSLHIMRNIETDNPYAKKIQKAIDTHMKNIDNTEYSKLSSIEKYYKTYEAIINAKAITGKNKIRANSLDDKAIKLLIGGVNKNGDATLTQDALNIIQKFVDTDRWSSKDKEALEKTVLSSGGGTFPEGRDILEDLLKEGNSNVPTTRKDMLVAEALLPKGSSKKEIKRLAAELKTRLDTLDKYHKNVTNHTASGDIITIDLSQWCGKYTREAVKDINAKARAKQEGWHVDVPDSYYGLADEFRGRMNIARENDSSMLVFNLNDQTDIDNFNSIASRLKIFGDRNYEISNKEDARKVMENLDNGWENAVKYNNGSYQYISLSKELQTKLSGLESPDFTKIGYTNKIINQDGSAEDYDVEKQLRAKIHMAKTSKRIRKLKGKDISILPIGTKSETQNIIEYDEATGTYTVKAGTAASNIANKETQVAIMDYADNYTKDNNMSTYFYIRSIINRADPKTFQFSYYGYDDSFINTLDNLKITGDEGFYEVMPTTREGVITLKLKDNQQEAMIKYLDESKDFNLFRILPLMSKTQSGKSNYVWSAASDGIITYKDSSGKEQTAAIPDMYNGNDVDQSAGLQMIYNMSVGFDTNNTLKARILGELANANTKVNADGGQYSYDPFDGQKKIMSDKDSIAIAKAYYANDLDTLEKYAENDYEAAYLASILKIERDYTTDDTSDDWKALYEDSNITKRLLKAKENGEDISSSNTKLVNEIATMYGNYYRANMAKYYSGDDGISYSYGSLPYHSTYVANDGLYANGQVLRGITNSNYLIDLDAPDFTEADLRHIVSDAVDKFNEISEDTSIRGMMNIPNTLAVFEQNDALRCLQGVVGNDGYIPIEDCEHWANLTDAQLNAISEAYGNKLTYQDVKQIQSAAKSLLKIVNSFDGSDQSSMPKEYRAYSNLGISVSVDNGKLVTDGDNLDPLTKDMVLRDYDNSSKGRTTKLADDFTDSINDDFNKLTSDDIYSKIKLNQDSEIRHRFASPHTAEVLEMENVFSMEQASEIISKTIDSVKNSFVPQDKEDKISSAIARDMFYAAMDTTANTEWQKMKIYDKNGEDILNTGYDNHNFFEIYTKLDSLDREGKLKEATFVQLDKHSRTSYDPITFQYTKLDNQNVQKIKNYFLVNAFETYMSRTPEWRGKDTETFVNHLRGLYENHPESYNQVLRDITNTQLSKQAFRQLAIDGINEVLPAYKKSEAVFNIVNPQIVGRPAYGNEALKNYVEGVVSSLSSDNLAEQAQASLAVYGIHKRMLDKEQDQLLSKQTDYITKDIIVTKQNNSSALMDIKKLSQTINGSESYHKQLRHILDTYKDIDPVNFLKAYIAYSDSAEALSYKTSGVTLEQMMNSEDLFDTSLKVHTDNGLEKMSLVTFRNKLSNLQDGESICYFDIEGIIPDKESPDALVRSTGTLDDIFQVHMSVETSEGTKDVTYYITHGRSAKQYIEDKKLRDNPYYKNESGYKAAVDEYAEEKQTDGIQTISEEQFIKMLNNMENTTFIAYNGDSYDFNYITPHIKGKNNVTLDATEFDAMTYAGDDIDRRIQKMVIGKDLVQSFTREAHDAKADTEMMKQWATTRIESFVDPTLKSKTKMLSEIDSLLDELSIDSDNRFKIYSELDNSIRSSRDEIPAIALKFNQGMPDASTTSYITRMLNSQREENLGYAIYNFINDSELWDKTGFTSLEKPILSGELKNKVLDLVTQEMLDNEGMTAKTALAKVFNRYQEEGDLFNDTVYRMIEDDITVDRTNEKFQQIRNLLTSQDNQVDSMYKFISQEDKDNFKKHQTGQKFEMYANKMVNEEGFEQQSYMTEEMRDSILEDATTLLSSSKDGIEQFNKPITLRINSSTAKKLEPIASKYTDIKGFVSFFRQGSYKRIHSISPSEGTSMFQELLYNPSTNRLEKSKEGIQIDSSTILIDRKALYDMTGSDIKPVFDEEGNMYIATHRQPSADKHQINYFKVKVVEGNNGDVYATPMIWRSIFAGDFDGDATTQYIITDPFEKRLAQFRSTRTYLTHDIQENLFKELIDTAGKPKERSLIPAAMALSNDPEIIKVSYAIDKALASGNEETLNNKLLELRNLITDKKGSYDTYGLKTDDIMNIIGVQEMNGHKYIRNFNVMNDTTSHSYEETFKIPADLAAIKTNLSDSIFGFHKQRFMSNEVTTNNLEDSPMTKMYLTPARMTGELLDQISSRDWNKQELQSYFSTLTSTISKYVVNSDAFSSETNEFLTTKMIPYINDLVSDISSIEDVDTRRMNVIANTQFIMNALDDTIRYDSKMNNDLSSILMDESLPLSTVYQENLDRHKQLLNDMNNIKGFKDYVRGGANYYDATDGVLISEIMKGSYRDQGTVFDDHLLNKFNDNRLNVAILEGVPLDGAVDTMYVNANSSKRYISGVQPIDLEKAFTSEYKYVQDVFADIIKSDGSAESLDKISPQNIQKYITELNKVLQQKQMPHDKLQAFINEIKDVNYRNHLPLSYGLDDLYEESVESTKALNELKRQTKEQIKELTKLSNTFFNPDGTKKAMVITNSGGDTYIVNLESLAGKKGFALGKGMIQDVKVISGDKNADWDIAFSTELLSRIDKLGYHTTFKNKKKGLYNITLQTKTGEPTAKEARIFTDVPFFLLENFNATQSGKPQKIDMMSILSLQGSMEDIGFRGTNALQRKDGHASYSNQDIIKAINTENDSKDIYWANTAGMELKQRAIGLGNIIDKNDLWDKYNEYSINKFGINPNINSADDFQQALLHGYNPCSLEMYDAIQGTINFLKSVGYSYDNLLEQMSPRQREAFSLDIENALTQYQQGAIKDYNGIRIPSKSKAKSSLANRTSTFVGFVYNPGEKNARRNVGVTSQEFFYVPANLSYRVHNNGYSVSADDAMWATYNDLLQYNKHYPGEQGLGFKPLNKKYAVLQGSNLTDMPTFNDPKQGHSGVPDQNVVLPTNNRVFTQQQKDYYVDNTPRHTGMYYQKLARNSTDYETRVYKSTRLGVLMDSLISNRNIPDALIEASPRNIAKELTCNLYTNKYQLNEAPVLTVVPKTKTGTYANLTDKGRDFVTSKMNFYTYKDIYNKQDVPEVDLSKVTIPKDTTAEDQKVILETYGVLQKAFKDNSRKTKNFTQTIDQSNIQDDLGIKFTYGADNVDVFENSNWSSSGIKIHKGDKGDTINVSMALEKAYGDAESIMARSDELRNNIRKAMGNTDPKVFQDWCTYTSLTNAKLHGEDISKRLQYIGVDENYFNTTMKQNYETLNSDPVFNKAANTYIDYKLNMIKYASDLYDEPIKNTMMFLSPMVSTKHKEMQYGVIKNAIRASLDFNEYDPIKRDGTFKDNMMFDFFGANQTMDREIAKLISTDNVTKVLHGRGLVSNVETVNKLNEYLTNDFDINKLFIPKDKLMDPENLQIHNTILDVVQSKTDIDIQRTIKGAKGWVEQTKMLWNAVNYTTEEALQALPEGTNLEYSSLKAKLASNPDREIEPLLKNACDAIEAKILVAQRIMELSPRCADNVENYFNSIYKSGYTLVNKYGQKLSKDSFITPIGDSSTKWLVDNIEIAANNQDSRKWNQFLVEKALRGELYLAKADLADQLEEKYFTTKVPNKVLATLKKISTASASIQMAMPAKMLGRLFRFTGTDYMLASTYSPKTIPNIPRAAKEISAAIYSNGASVEEGSLLDTYLKWEGQPINVSGKDPVTFTEDISKGVSNITDKLTTPLAWQNHYGRYAIWLTAYESFENGDPIYGPAYHLKNQIDNLTKIDPETGEVVPDNAAKATFVMDYMIGSPGGFPYLSKKTNGLMMYATFPMNLTRTAGAYAMSLGQLFQEGITSENAPQWLRTVAAPSCTTLVAAYLGNLLISYVCDKYGIPEEKEEEWKKEGVTIDPIGTMMGGTPSIVYDSMIPLYQIKEMYANPILSEYNKTFGDKVLGEINQNILSKLNPAIKAPAEVILQKDFFGSSKVDTSKTYSRYENGLRKVLGFMFGSGVADSLIQANKTSQYEEDSKFLSTLWKGFTRGLSNDLGNQKSWKKDVSNYYAVIDSIKNYNYANASKNGWDATYEDLTDGNYMKYRRNSTSSYGSIDQDEYYEVNKQLKTMLNNKENPTTIYTYIADMYNKGVSEATLRKALNNNSLIRKLSLVNKADYYRTLSDRDLINLEKAIKWEEETYPLLKDFFPNTVDNVFRKYRKPYYKTGSGSDGGNYYPKSYYPKTPKHYPSNGYSHKQYNNYKPSAKIKRVNVEVSPQMGVWTNDYNKVVDPQHWKDQNYNRVKPLNHGGGK